LILFSDRGTPDTYHQQHGYSGHTLKFVNADGNWHYVQVHVRADKGFKTLTDEQAGQLAGSNPDYGTQSLFETIEKGEFPSWTVYVVRTIIVHY
jgi:catalase